MHKQIAAYPYKETLSGDKKELSTDRQMDGCRSVFWGEKKIQTENITDSFYMIYVYEMLEKSKWMPRNKHQMNGAQQRLGNLMEKEQEGNSSGRCKHSVSRPWFTHVSNFIKLYMLRVGKSRFAVVRMQDTVYSCVIIDGLLYSFPYEQL